MGYCRNNHERTEANTYFTSKGKRVCRTCRNESARRYHQRLAARGVIALAEKYRCGRCRDDKLVDQFQLSPASKRGVRAWCRACDADNNREKTYGISAEEYLALFEKQGGACAICPRTEDLCVDHDHETGIVRGLLCRVCNAALGGFRDDPVLLRAALEYLTEKAFI